MPNAPEPSELSHPAKRGGRMSEEAVQQWTDAIDEDEEGPRAHRSGG